MMSVIKTFYSGACAQQLHVRGRPTFGYFVGIGAVQLQLLQGGWQVVFLLGGQILQVEAVVIEQQSQLLQRAL